MKLVKEHINFQRGLDPKAAMGIGYKNMVKNKIIDLYFDGKWSNENDFDVIQALEYKDHYILLIKNKRKTDPFPYITLYVNDRYGSESTSQASAEDAIKFAKRAINGFAPLIGESLEFQRGLNPKDAMSIGSINLNDVYYKMVVKPRQEWNKYLDSFKGKKVVFHVDKSYYSSSYVPNILELIVDKISCNNTGDIYMGNDDDGVWYVDKDKEIFIVNKIHETMHFERGLDPKRAMDVGGVVFQEKYDEILKDPFERWKAYLRSSLQKRTISGDIRVWNPDSRKWLKINTPIKIISVIFDAPVGEEINFEGEDKRQYYFNLTDKVYIS